MESKLECRHASEAAWWRFGPEVIGMSAAALAFAIGHGLLSHVGPG